MRSALRISIVLLLSVLCGVKAQEAPALKPLTDCELLALVGGNALPENIVARLAASGINFHPNSAYREQLKIAGATDAVLEAMDNAKVDDQGSCTASKPDLLQHLSVASQLANKKRYDEAIEELDIALAAGYKGPDTGFVLGRILAEEEEYEGALTVYNQILKLDPQFPEVHTKLSFIYHRGGDDAEALNQAQIALQATPDNAEAHKFAGIALNALDKFSAAKTEFEAALRLKPEYQSAHLDLGVLYDHMRQSADAIREYKSAIALDPNDVDAHFSLANTLTTAGDSDGAISEYRAAKDLDPSRYDIRQDLASALLEKDVTAAISELREMEAMYPEKAVCHECLANALFRSGDVDGAAAEYKTAVRIDPNDAVLRDLYAEALNGAGQTTESIPEFEESLSLDPTDVGVRLHLAKALEKNLDWVSALTEYRKAVEFAAAAHHEPRQPADSLTPQQQYEAAQKRFAQYIDQLNASGRSAEAAALQKRVASSVAVANNSGSSK